jgi:signal transduction histidine kinase
MLARPIGHPALGIQQRIMLYVTIGLLLIFGSAAFVGLTAIQQATDLVYQERLTRAYTIAGTLESDLRHVAGDAREQQRRLREPGQGAQASEVLLDHLAHEDALGFFRVTGVWVLGADGQAIAAAGLPLVGPTGGAGASDLIRASDQVAPNTFRLVPPVDANDRHAFGVILVPLDSDTDPQRLLIAIHTEAANDSAPYLPSFATADAAALAGQNTNPAAGYHLEVVRPDGQVALGIGPDERPGDLSHHYPIVQRLAAGGEAASLLHTPQPGEAFEQHVMAAVPLAGSAFYVVLEQAVDVALALPLQLEQRLAVLTVAGFLTALGVAWVTTSHVVKPTQQLTTAARRMAQGDLESPIGGISGSDEVARLAQSLESMRRQLRAAYQQLESTNHVLESQVRERTARLGELLEKLISAQEDERARLARELHDETAQTLGALSIALDRARDELAGAHPRSAEQLAEARAIAVRLLEETRRLILDLRPMALDDLGLGPAIRWYTETHLEEQGVATSLEFRGLSRRLPGHVEVTLFRVIQEAVNNITKHAHATEARIRLHVRRGRTTVLIADNGQGFDPSALLGLTVPVRSVGLVGMQERVRLLNGQLRIRSRPGQGTTLAVEIPLLEEVV